jgi:hypothetical protein
MAANPNLDLIVEKNLSRNPNLEFKVMHSRKHVPTPEDRESHMLTCPVLVCVSLVSLQQ